MLLLKKKSSELLKICLEKHNSDLLYIFKDENNIKIDSALGNKLQDAVCDELILCGFDSGVINSYGSQLEELIDEIGHMFIY